MQRLIIGSGRLSANALLAAASAPTTGAPFSIEVDPVVIDRMNQAADDYITLQTNKSRKGKKKGKAKQQQADAAAPAANTSAPWTSAAPAAATSAPLQTAGPASSRGPPQPERIIRRAIMLVRAWTLAPGLTCVRAQVVQLLAELLNHDIVSGFALDSDSVALEGVAELVQGRGEGVAEALAAAGLEPVELTVAERDAFVGGLSPSVAVAGLMADASETTVNLADHAAALTCEAFGAFTQPFEKLYTEDLRNHDGQRETAAALRSLLSGSQLANKSKRKEMDPRAIRCIAQYHGPVREQLALSTGAVRTELNSVEPQDWEPDTPKACGGAFDAQPVLSALSNLHTALAVVASRSLERSQLLLGELKDDTTYTSKIESSSAPAVAEVLQNVGRFALMSVQDDESCLSRVRAMFESSRRVRDVVVNEVTVGLRIVADKDEQVFSQMTRAYEKKKAKYDKQLAALKAEEEAEAAAAADGDGQAKKKKKKKKKKLSPPTPPKGVTLGAGATLLLSLLTEDGAAPRDWQAKSDDDVIRALDTAAQRLGPYSAFGLGPVLKQSLMRGNDKVDPRTAKGTQDFEPDQMAVRERVFEEIVAIFRRHGAVSIDTPVFELREVLTNKYGEDSKLIYDLADQGGEALSLRYDLTVPFARYLAQRGAPNIKRYHIGKVYRRDQPQMKRGRFREFYQCDFDVAGKYAPMQPDAEVLKVLTEILSEVGVGQFAVKINHRRLLDGLMEVCGVPPEKFRTICSAIDKLDKEPWDVVRAEMTQEKGLDEAVADRLGEFVMLKDSPYAMLERLRSDEGLSAHAGAALAFEEMDTLFSYLRDMGCLDFFSFDMSLARGLDYYTGVIYEAVLTGDNPNGVGSIAAGGRYDNLVESFCGKNLPVVGVSIGIERVFAILYNKAKQDAQAAFAARQSEDSTAVLKGSGIRAKHTDVLVASVGPNLTGERLKLCSQLWSRGVGAEFVYRATPKPIKQMERALHDQVPFVIWLGQDEIEQQVVKLKDVAAEEEIVLPHDLDQIVAEIRKRQSNRQ